MEGERALWTLDVHLLAAAVDLLQAGNWQRGGGRGQRPRRLPRPGAANRLGRTDRDPDEVRAYLDRFKPQTEGG